MATERTKLIKDYREKILQANKELTKKEIFKDLLNRLYANDRDIVHIIDKISAGAEHTILNIPRKDKVHSGSADTLYNKIIIEFEKDLKKTGKHAVEQLAGYLLGQFNSKEGYNFTLVASDFINWKVYAPDIDQIDQLGTLHESELKLHEIPSSSFTLTDKNADDFYYWLDRFLFKEEKQKATLKRIEEAFGYQSQTFIESLREMTQWFDEAKKFGEVQVSYEQWKKFLSIAYGSYEATERNFLIHTYLSVFAKMIAYEVVSNDDYIDDDELLGILDGNLFNKYNVRNFIDNDFFHWVKSPRNFRELKKVFRLVAQEMSTFDFTNVDEDILKGVYQELIDLDTRHALGEYYTPDWLCERIVQEFDFKPGDHILDPACGSGSFLRAAIHRLKTLHPDIQPEEVANSIYGIDIHPLSVQIAKTTMLLALGKEVVHARRPIHINIILANSLLAPEGVANLFGGEFRMNIDKEKLVINTQVLEDVHLFDEALEVCDQLAEQTMNKKKESLPTFHSILRKHYKHGGINEQIAESYYKIYEGLKTVKEKGRDSIWKFIVQNGYKPYFLKGKFDYIIGNPPWFTYSSIRNEEYQDILNRLAVTYAVKPDRVANFPHLEIAAIFMAYCSGYYLKEGGALAFVLPRSFLSADHHDNTRSGKAKGFKLISVWDLQDVMPLFRVPSCVLFAQNAVVAKKMPASGIEGKSVSGRLPVHNCNLETALPKLRFEADKWYYNKQGKSSALSNRKLKTQNKVNPYKSEFKQGATIVPRSFYFVELTQDIPPDWDDRIINVKTAGAVQTDAKKPWKGLDFSGKIESKYLFRTALSKSILPFALYKPDLVVLPVHIAKEQGKTLVKMQTADDIRKTGDLEAAKWFQNAENIWNTLKTEKSKGMQSYDRVNFQNGITNQYLDVKFIVLYNSSAKDANATVLERSSLDLHFFVESVAYSFFTYSEDEAYYLSSIFNSTTPNELMKDFQARGLFGARHVHKKILDIYYPRYDRTNELHLQLAAYGKSAHDKAAQYLKDNPPRQELTAIHLGRLRTAIKKHLSAEMKEIDKLVKKLLKSE